MTAPHPPPGSVEAEESARARQNDFLVHEEQPLNAEPSVVHLVENTVTPISQVYHRNHDPLRPATASSADEWTLTIELDEELGAKPEWKQWLSGQPGSAPSGSPGTIKVTSRELRGKYPRRRFAAAIECAGNRRIEFNEERKTEGIEWEGGTVASLIWAGTPVRQLLLSLGAPDPYQKFVDDGTYRSLPPSEQSVREDAADFARDLHAHFISSEQSHESDKGEAYASSIPLGIAMHPTHGCLLAYEHNDEPLTPAHGFPLRAVLPGIVGARWTKYLCKLRISAQPDTSPAMKGDYKQLQPPKGASESEVKHWLDEVSTDGEHSDAAKRQQEMEKLPPIQRLGIGSAIAEPHNGQSVKAKTAKGSSQKTVRAKGYAVGSDGQGITDVQIAVLVEEPGKQKSSSDLRAEAAQLPEERWISASLQRALEDDGAEKGAVDFAWTLWHLDVPLPAEVQGKIALVARAATSSSRQQQESEWNLRGFAQRGWPCARDITLL